MWCDKPKHNGIGSAEWKSSEILQFYMAANGKSLLGVVDLWPICHRLQSVQNAAARLIFRARRYDHVQPLLRSLHWLRVPERISFRLAVLVYRCLHGSAPGYLASYLQRVSDLGARRRLCSSSTSALVAPRTARATIGDRAFPAAAASVWNSLPETVRSSPSLPVFRSRLKTELFARSYSCWLMNVSLHWLLRDRTIIVTCPCSPRTYATLKSIRPSSSSSSS